MRRAAPFPQIAIACVVACAWALAAVLYFTDHQAALSHHRLASGHGPAMSVLFLLGSWQIMTAAMMLPTYLPAIRYVLRNTLPGRQGRAAVECVAAYFAVWSVFGFAATLADTAVHQGLAGAANTHLPFVAALVVASVWQITPKKRAFLGGCRTGRVLAAHGWKADAACIRFGVRYAVSCVGSCWALMLVMFAAGAAHLAWMILLAALVWAEKTRPFGYDLARPSAAVLAVAAGVVLLT